MSSVKSFGCDVGIYSSLVVVGFNAVLFGLDEMVGTVEDVLVYGLVDGLVLVFPELEVKIS
jgi:hypothetical protein